MRRSRMWTTSLGAALAAIVAIGAAAQESEGASVEAAAPVEGQGWTGLTNPMDVIAARGALMAEMEQLMIPIDSYTAGDVYDLDMLRENAAGVARLLTVVPHLFPPTTNLYDPDAEIPVTLAQPELWENFDTFYRLATAASGVADEASSTQDPEAFRQQGLAIRAACAACHDTFLLPYVPETVNPEEFQDFDFGTFD